jgi:hypothetical protein
MARQAARATLDELPTIIAQENTGGVRNISLVKSAAKCTVRILQVVAEAFEAVQLVDEEPHHLLQ